MAATVVKGSGTSYTGVTGTITSHTNEDFSRMFAEAVFDETAVLKALGARAWNGKGDVGNSAKSSGRGIVFGNGFQFSGKMAVTAPAATRLTKGGTVQAAERDDWTGWAYDWERLMVTLGIPEEDIQDNSGGSRLASLLNDELQLGKMGMANSINQVFLGNASAPTGLTTIGLNYLVSVTQTGSIGGISRTNAYWKNWQKALVDVGGGGDIDKPLALKRALEGAILGTSGYASVSGPDLLIATEGAYLTTARMSERLDGIADTNKVEKKFYDIGIPHMLVHGRPMVYDKDVTVPWGGTASKDCIYGINTKVTGLSFKSQEYFRVEKWMPPNARSTQRTYRSNVFCRCMPYCKDRRANFVIYNMTANSEGTSD